MLNRKGLDLTTVVGGRPKNPNEHLNLLPETPCRSILTTIFWPHAVKDWLLSLCVPSPQRLVHRSESLAFSFPFKENLPPCCDIQPNNQHSKAQHSPNAAVIIIWLYLVGPCHSFLQTTCNLIKRCQAGHMEVEVLSPIISPLSCHAHVMDMEIKSLHPLIPY